MDFEDLSRIEMQIVVHVASVFGNATDWPLTLNC